MVPSIISRATYLSSFAWALFCCLRTSNFVLSQDGGESSWTILQFEGLDELFVQTRQFGIARELESANVRVVCDSVNAQTYGAFVRANNFRSSIRSQIEEADAETASRHEDDGGYRIYHLNDEIRVHLYQCSETFFLTYAYEDEHLFFLFVYDACTREMALEALVQEKATVSGHEASAYEGDEDEISYVGQRETFYEYLYSGNGETIKDHGPPENDWLGDPVCRGSVELRVRLCTSVLSIPYYKNKYTFSPCVANVDTECRETYIDLKNNFDTRLAEFMYRCWVTDIDDPTQRIAIYLSRSYRNYEVFASKILQTGAAAAAAEDGLALDLVKLEKDVGGLFFIIEPKYNEEMDTILMQDVAHYRSAVNSELLQNVAESEIRS